MTFAPIDPSRNPAAANGMFEAVMGGARPRVGVPPFGAPFPQTGGANAPTTPDTLPAKKGLSGLIERMFNPSNALGQFGQALLASSGGPLGNAIGLMLQQRMAAGKRDSAFEDWKRQYEYERANPKPSQAQPYRFKNNDGDLMELGPDGRPMVLYDDPREKIDWQVVDNGDGTKSLIPIQSSVGGKAAAPTSLGTGEKPDWSKLGGGAGNGTGGFPVSVGTLDRITAQGESGNRDFYAPGRPVVSPKGARFAMQVMPDTARDPGFGLRPANPNDPADMNRLGREYRAAMQRRYGGDPRKMWAAYNAGPGRVDGLIAEHGEDWLRHAPRETRAYVNRNVRALMGDR